MALPRPPKPDWAWAAEVLRTTGQLPRDDPEQWFPRALLAQWFKDALCEVNEAGLEAAADGLLDAQTELSVTVAFQLELRANALPQRKHIGPSAALRKDLKTIALQAERVRAALKAIRGELLLHRAESEDGRRLERVHLSLHQGFLEGQHRRQWATGKRTLGNFDPNAEVGPRATMAPTWLEEGLAFLASTAEAAMDESPALPKPRGTEQSKPARDRFVRDVAEVWFKATGTRPTVQTREDQLALEKQSPFQKFHERVCGHVAGLRLRDGGIDWDQLTRPERDVMRNEFRSLGLCNLSPAKLAQLVRGTKFDPGSCGSKSGPDGDGLG
jgi:hypothetical protein